MGIMLPSKQGVSFDFIDAGGFRILGSLEAYIRTQPHNLTITCGTEGHPHDDPHTLGRAYDVRTHDLTHEQKQKLLYGVMVELAGKGDMPVPVSIGLATRHFYGQIENPGLPNEHFHVQQRNGVQFP